MFIPDTPIESTSDDQLNRVGFAQKLGETIRDWNRDESIVIGLFGPWGSGKTSVLNLAINHIERTAKNWEADLQPIIIRFNPWTYSEKNVLLNAFLQQVFSSVNNRLPVHKKDFQKQINSLARALGGLEKIPVAGIWLNLTGKTIDLINPQETLEALRKKIDDHFRQLDGRVLIVIDDIDRLTQSEIRQLFQIIKINADFPNTIYLVAFDRIIVEKALNTEQGVAGRDYLEKIVQVGFDIPSVDKSYIERELFGGIDKILETAQIDEGLWDKIRWGNLYYGGISALFQSLRDVKRLINSLSFNLQVIAAEVNTIDFIGLEALRVFIPEVYSAIANNKLLFTQTGNLVQNGNEQRNLKEQFDKIFFLPPEKFREIGKQVCIQLFPIVASIYQPGFGGDYRQRKWRQARRICSEDVFDFFFSLGTPKGEISRTELELILNIAYDPDRLTQIFRRLVRDERFPRLLDLLPDIRGQLDRERALGLCQALLVIGDEIPNENRGFLKLNTDFQLALELYLILQILDQNERCQWLAERVRSGQTIYMPVYVVWHDTPQEGKERENALFSDACFEMLKSACVKQIEIRAKERTLQNAKHFSLLLFRWKAWVEDDESIGEFVEFMVSSPQNALIFLLGFLNQTNIQTIGDHIGSSEWYIDIKNLSEFVDIQHLQEITDKITEDDAKGISEQYWIALDAFRRAMNELQSAQ